MPEPTGWPLASTAVEPEVEAAWASAALAASAAASSAVFTSGVNGSRPVALSNVGGGAGTASGAGGAAGSAGAGAAGFFTGSARDSSSALPPEKTRNHAANAPTSSRPATRNSRTLRLPPEESSAGASTASGSASPTPPDGGSVFCDIGSSYWAGAAGAAGWATGWVGAAAAAAGS